MTTKLYLLWGINAIIHKFKKKKVKIVQISKIRNNFHSQIGHLNKINKTIREIIKKFFLCKKIKVRMP